MSATAFHASPPSLADVLSGRDQGRHMERTGNPCWRDSYDVDDERCARFVHQVDPDEQGPFLQGAEEFNRQTKERGKRCGLLRMWGKDVLRYLWTEASRNKGVCCPSKAQIAEALKIALSTVNATLEALRVAGFLEWTRRTVMVEGDGPGPRRQQTTNLYRFTLPKAVAWRVSKFMVRRFGRRPGLPRSIAAALSMPELQRRAVTLDAAKQLRRRKASSVLDRVRALAQGLNPSPTSGLS